MSDTIRPRELGGPDRHSVSASTACFDRTTASCISLVDSGSDLPPLDGRCHRLRRLRTIITDRDTQVGSNGARNWASASLSGPGGKLAVTRRTSRRTRTDCRTVATLATTALPVIAASAGHGGSQCHSVRAPTHNTAAHTPALRRRPPVLRTVCTRRVRSEAAQAPITSQKPTMPKTLRQSCCSP